MTDPRVIFHDKAHDTYTLRTGTYRAFLGFILTCGIIIGASLGSVVTWGVLHVLD